MKITNTACLLLLTAASSSAFAPMPTSSSRTMQRTTGLTTPAKANPNERKTTLFQSDNTIDQLKDKAEEATKFLVVDYQRAQDDLARNWGWIAGAGFLNMILGFAAFYLPMFATSVAYDGTVLTLGATGFVGLLSAFARENGHKLKSALSGLGYMVIAYYMGTNPGAGLDIITLTIATVLAVEGFYETALAAKNKDLEGRPWHFVSGIGSVAASVFLAANVPAASLVTPGVALGARLTSNGATKVAVGFAGKELADARKGN